MTREAYRIKVTVACLAVMSALPLGAVGALVPMDLDDLADRCEHAIAGEVTVVTSHWNPDGTNIFTDIKIQVLTDYKGNFAEPNGILTLTELGGTVGPDTIVVQHAPSFNVGEKVLVFTERTPDGRLIVMGRARGKLTLKPAPGLTLQVRAPQATTGPGPGSGTLVYGAEGRSIAEEVGALMAARGHKPVRLSVLDSERSSSEGAIVSPAAQPVKTGDVIALPTPLPKDAYSTEASVVGTDGGSAPLSCSGTTVFSNTGGTAFVKPGVGVQIADDLTLVGAIGCSISCYTLSVYAASGASSYNVTAGLYYGLSGQRWDAH